MSSSSNMAPWLPPVPAPPRMLMLSPDSRAKAPTLASRVSAASCNCNEREVAHDSIGAASERVRRRV